MTEAGSKCTTAGQLLDILTSFSAFFARPDSFFEFPPLGGIVCVRRCSGEFGDNKVGRADGEEQDAGSSAVSAEDCGTWWCVIRKQIKKVTLSRLGPDYLRTSCHYLRAASAGARSSDGQRTSSDSRLRYDQCMEL